MEEPFFKTHPVDKSATVSLSDGTKVGIPRLKEEPGEATAQDIRNILMATLEIAENLDKRLAALEKH
jgi:hypothetical protein